MASRMGFHEWLRHRNDVFFNLVTGANSRDEDRWYRDRQDANVWTWRRGTDAEKVYDFNPYFPSDTGRKTVDQREGYMFAVYEHRGGTGEFVPYGDDPDD